MAPPWIVLATDRRKTGGEVPAVQRLYRGRRGLTMVWTFSLEDARRFPDESAATLFASECQRRTNNYLFTPFKLY